MKSEQRKQVENYIFYSIFIATVLIFMVSPSHITSSFDYYLNEFIDKYLLGNGYYSPSNYPFAAKVTNSFSVVLAVASGIFIGIWRKNDVEREEKYAWLGCLIALGLGIATFFLSLEPQEFRESTIRRSFGTSESFHNNPILFLFLMISKQGCIYMGIRITLTFLLYDRSRFR